MSEIRRMLLEFEVEQVGKKARSDSKVRKALVNAFSDASETIRERALIAAVEVADPSLVVDVVKSMTDDEVAVRVAAAQALAWYRQPRTIPVLLNGLKDPNTWVRSHSAFGLSKLLSGPIWARVSREDVDKMLGDFSGMDEIEVTSFLEGLGMTTKAVNDFTRWSRIHFEMDVDAALFDAELEGKPIILEGVTIAEEVKPPSAKAKGLPKDVEDILSEIPPDLRATLPEEDLRRLTPETARELVDSLKASFPQPEEEKPVALEEPSPKKVVKVRKVKKVKRVRKGPTREELLERIPPEVKASVPKEELQKLDIDELEALVATSEDAVPGAAETTETAEEETPEDPKLRRLTEKFGDEKARLLAQVPDDVLAGLPDEQIREMDIDTLSGLLDTFLKE